MSKSDSVSRNVYEQVAWERNIAMQQLNEHGIPFGGIAPDVKKIVRCKNCVHENLTTCPLCYIENQSLIFVNHDPNFYCGKGESNVVGKDDTSTLLLKPGDEVWAIDRTEYGEAVDVTGYMYLATVGNYVIATSYINDLENVEETLYHHMSECRDNIETHLVVLELSDCYSTKDEATEQWKKE